MSDIFENDIELEYSEDYSQLDDVQDQDTGPSLQVTEPLCLVRLDYSCENFYATKGSLALKPQDLVVIDTRYGLDVARFLGQVNAPSGVLSKDMTRISRLAAPQEIKKMEENKKHEQDAGKIFKEKVRLNNLEMKLITVHFMICEPKIIFFFSAESRVDFRSLVRDLVAIFRTRIELRQIGVRDEARIIGGLGPCGRAFCCHSISDKLKSVNIKMVKDQGLSLNSQKITGQCGRLLCCLANESDYYIDAKRQFPPVGLHIYYDETNFRVQEINYITGMVKMLGEEGRALEINGKRFSYVNGSWIIDKKGEDDDTQSI